MLNLHLPGCDGGEIRPVGQCDFLVSRSHGVEFQAAEITQRHLAQKRGRSCVILIQDPRGGAEDHHMRRPPHIVANIPTAASPITMEPSRARVLSHGQALNPPKMRGQEA